MGNEADDILASLSLSEGDKKKWDKVTEGLMNYFIPKRNVILERTKFNQRIQMADESVDTFVTSLFSLAENCKFGILHDELIRDKIVVGLRDHRLSEKLQLDAELTLEKAVTQARQHKAVRSQLSEGLTLKIRT